ncbi:hypothetical protein WJX84_011320 [Apatococcus fuscideae]|uniref:Uncharacterized protein n=1 Tax=Apatococcus fuscideae TaxID=2026836 RepID=A0AAW1T6Y6_9CHLO
MTSEKRIQAQSTSSAETDTVEPYECMPAPEADWHLMQSAAGRHYFLDVTTNDVRMLMPTAVRASPSHEAAPFWIGASIASYSDCLGTAGTEEICQPPTTPGSSFHHLLPWHRKQCTPVLPYMWRLQVLSALSSRRLISDHGHPPYRASQGLQCWICTKIAQELDKHCTDLYKVTGAKELRLPCEGPQLREQRPASCRECLPGWASKMLFKAATINTGPCAAMLGEAAYVCPSAYPFIGTKDRLSSYIMADSPGQSGWDK